jgi:hypothetical protein
MDVQYISLQKTIVEELFTSIPPSQKEKKKKGDIQIVAEL